MGDTIEKSSGVVSGEASATASGPAGSAESGRQSGGAPAKPTYPPAASVPTQQGPRGVRFDFNEGCRVLLTEGEHPWRVRIFDLDTGNVLYETQIKAGRVSSSKRYYLRFRVDVWQQDESVLSHDYSAAGQPVLIQFPLGTLGDTLGWFPYAVKFQEKHHCQLTCAMAERLIPLFRDTHPGIEFVTHEEVEPERYYATYSIGLFFDDKDGICQPSDFRHVGLHRTAGYILGVDPTEVPPRLAVDDDTRPIPDPYVCIAVQSTTQSKCWNNPAGWHEIVGFLKGSRLPRRLHRPEAGAWHRHRVEPHPARGRGRDRRPAIGRAHPLAAPRRFLHRPLKRAGLAGLGFRHAGGDDQRLHPPDQRVHHTLPDHQLPRL